MITALILAVLIGVSLGLLGGGGSILAVPLLVYVVHLGPRDAVATSLLVVGAASAAAMIPHARAGRVSVRVGLVFGAASMVGAFAGGHLAHLLDERLLLGGFTAVMVITALAMMRPRREVVEESREDGAAKSSLSRTSLIGVAIGVLTGVVGAGGGFVIVPALVLLCGLSMRAAVGTSLLVIAMNSFAAFAGAASHASVPWGVAGAIGAAAVAGSLIGATLTKRIAATVLRKGFAWFVLAMALFMVWKQLPAAVTTSIPVLPLLLGLASVGSLFAAFTHRRTRRTASIVASRARRAGT